MLANFISNYSYLIKVLNLLSPADNRKLVYLGLIQFFLSILDLIGLLLIAAVTSIGLSIVSLVPIPSSLTFILSIPILKNFSTESVVIALSLLAALLLILKTVTNALITRKVTGFLALREAHLSSRYMNFVSSSSPKWQRSKSPQYIAGVAMEGANSAFTLSLGQLVNLVVECCSILMLFIGISTFDPSVTIPSLVFFIISGWATVTFLSSRTRNAGRENYFLGISSSELVKNMVSGARELFVSNKQDIVAEQFANQRIRNYQAVRSKALITVIPKYVSEITLVVGGILIAALQFALKDPKEAITSLVVFTALSSRLLPSLLKVQGAVLQIKGSGEATKNFLSEFEEAEDSSMFLQSVMGKTTGKIGFKGTIDLVDISANHFGEESFELKSISLAIEEGEFLAIVGPSGSGKSTLVDVMLGIITPTSGYSKISGVQPALAMRIWPNKIRYVPQDIQLVSGSILENIIWPDLDASLNAVELQRLLELVELDEWINSLDYGINTRINSLGSNLSGGQRQRIGIARALYASPQILFLDESTSSLDTQTEREIIDKVVGEMSTLTRIVISHRVSTIRNADKIVYIENGSIRAVGKYSELVAKIPSFGVEYNFE